MLQAATWVFMLLSITGVVLNVKKLRICFIFWIPANMGWIAVNLYKDIHAQALLFVVYTSLSVWGWTEWGKDKPRAQKNRAERVLDAVLFPIGRLVGKVLAPFTG